MSPTSENASRVLASTLSGTTLLIFVQLASRLFIFLSNQMVLRSLSPSILGIAAQLELFLISILYFSRESIRTAIQRQPAQFFSPNSGGRDADINSANGDQKSSQAQSNASQSIVNMSYLSPGIGILLATTFAACYMHFAPYEVSETPFYQISVIVTAIASLIELSTEPFFAVVQNYMLYKERAAVEISAAFMKSLAVCGVSVWAAWHSYSLGALPFALGYLSYSFTLVCGYSLVLMHMRGGWDFSFRLTRIKSSNISEYFAGRFPWPLISLSSNVFFQSIVKHLLTQGDSMILAALASLEDQGIYSLASNYGGLLARILFQPIEESSRALFSSLLSSKVSENQGANIKAAKSHLVNIMQGYMVLSILIFPLGPALVPRILHILGGQRWTVPDVDTLLALYCYYIPFLAFNGISEAFVSSTASPAEVRKQAGWMSLFSTCFALAAYLFLQIGGLGARGLVYANIVNMAVRIIWSFSFIRRYLRQYKQDLALAEFSVRPHTYVAGAVITAVLYQAEFWPKFNGALTPFIFGAIYILLV
ncbi:hypothetical protein P175DRAFT_0439402 [Aspergillus ochraceoroseus IBT 24754]|uniref:Man(5)GlcNAc(2)-PP-dolichol translocation protein RFT1 n=1 Tax=Aspergillus ochraceoroseus IBT 24754 TaxID=1392256 RepID=A0A2T5LV70_9EURO|nr:uncharacterized protein P175DRAFT_0439402 [Aspergillus ochraceoroseus IBT 24754]PTU20177.1 hypothetical protein P175DRAFT_0439402 [Aspergillus ochraceoroseus IBT 24754]